MTEQKVASLTFDGLRVTGVKLTTDEGTGSYITIILITGVSGITKALTLIRPTTSTRL